MFFKNARIYTPEGGFTLGTFGVEQGRFASVLTGQAPAGAIDLQGATVIPGLVDIHIHGCAGADAGDGTVEALQTMARYLARQGVTSFAPTTATLPYPALEKAFGAAAEFRKARPAGCARVLGVHMEGPYFCEKKKGAQNGAYLKKPDIEGFRQLYDSCGGLVRIVDIAPELPGAIEFIRQVHPLCRVSVAHTEASYEEACAAFAAGASHLTHTYNAMPGIHHRQPGVIPAAAEAAHVRGELICDGLHVHPAAVRLAFAVFGAERVCIISDALRCCGLPDGAYEMSGQMTYLRGGIARLENGVIAGSAANLFDCMRRAMEMGIPEADAVRAATWNPACSLGAQEEVGVIADGARADFIICRKSYTEKQVYLGGERI